MREILEKIRAVFGNWHNHVDPEKAIQGHLTDFAAKASDEIESAHGQIADVASRVSGLEALETRVTDLEGRNAALEQEIEDMKKVVGGLSKDISDLQKAVGDLQVAGTKTA